MKGLRFFLALSAGLFLAQTAFTQGQANNWYFGTYAGLNFSGGAPVAIAGSQIWTSEGCASISDAAGNLLFYTDGRYVWDKTNTHMPNGTGLHGDASSSQSAMIIQKPGSTTIYYIFAVAAIMGTTGVTYSEVDMTLHGGLGNVTANKNIPLYALSCEKITGVRHCNNKDVWVVTHGWNSNAFKTFLVTSAGVNTVPVVSNAGLVANSSGGPVVGCLKSSPDGTKLASASYGGNRFELFDFNKSTGVVSHEILFPPFSTGSGAYGVEFSPDGTKMYASETSGQIYQYDLCAGSDTLIKYSGVLIGTAAAAFNGSLQLGPDNKIYLAQYYVDYLGVINNPNTLGVACNYVDVGPSILPGHGAAGLPNFVPYYFNPPPPLFTVSVNCVTGTFTAPTVNTSNCSSSANAIQSVVWNFGDPASGANNTSSALNPTHIFTAGGSFTVSLVLNYLCGSDTIKQSLSTTTINCPLGATTSSTSELCKGMCTATATVYPTGGTTPYTYQWNTVPTQTTQVATGLCAGNYTVLVTDSAGTVITQSVTVTEPALLMGNVTVFNGCGTACNGTAFATANGGVPGYTYSWNTTPVQATQGATNLCAGNYTCTVTDTNGCFVVKTVNVAPFTLPIVSIDSFTNVSCNGSCDGVINASAMGGAGGYNYSWNTMPAQTTQSASNLCSGNYICTVTDLNTCSGNASVTITQPSLLTITGTVTPGCSGSSNSSATVTVTGGTSPYTVLWNSTPLQTGLIATNLPPPTVSVTATDIHNCTVTKSILVTEYPDISVLPYTNVFSPNGDKLNDAFFPFSIDPAHSAYSLGRAEDVIGEYELSVYDRWGILVFETKQVSNLWDGNETKGNAVPAGTYYWILKYKSKCGANPSVRNEKGFVQLIR